MSQARKPPDPVSQGSQGRLVSLDVLRGLTVIGMIVVNSAAGMESKAQVFPLLLHSTWDGLTLADIVFPGFLMMVGVSIPLALGRAKASGGFDSDQRRRIFWRTVRLVLLGFVLSNLWWFSDFSAVAWRLFGVLQRIGLAYGAAATLFFLCTPKVRLAIVAAILVLYWPLALAPSPDGLPTDLWVRGHNFIGGVDRMLLGAGNHIYRTGPEGYDPEGLLGTLPAVAHCLIGVAIGEFLLARPARSGAGRLALAGLAMLVAGVGWGFLFPVVKDIWSSSFVLVTCGITTLFLALLHMWLDGRDERAAGSGLLLAVALPFGTNAIAAYVLHEVTANMVGWDVLLAPFKAAAPAIGSSWASLLPVLLYTLFIWLCVAALGRRGWIVRI